MTLASLSSLTDSALQRLGVTVLGQRKRIQLLAAQIRPSLPNDTYLPPPGAVTSLLQVNNALQKVGGSSEVHETNKPPRTRITDYFEPPGGRKPAPAFQQPLETLTTAPRPRGSIADFFTRPTAAVRATAGASAPDAPGGAGSALKGVQDRIDTPPKNASR